jgi:multisubunit Na+/H+ antiporter MnhB subunit
MSRFPGGVLCAVSSVTLMLCALHLWGRESAGAGLSVAAVAVALLLAAVASMRAGMH